MVKASAAQVSAKLPAPCFAQLTLDRPYACQPASSGFCQFPIHFSVPEGTRVCNNYVANSPWPRYLAK
jgi:hypothetical protein